MDAWKYDDSNSNILIALALIVSRVADEDPAACSEYLTRVISTLTAPLQKNMAAIKASQQKSSDLLSEEKINGFLYE